MFMKCDIVIWYENTPQYNISPDCSLSVKVLKIYFYRIFKHGAIGTVKSDSTVLLIQLSLASTMTPRSPL